MSRTKLSVDRVQPKATYWSPPSFDDDFLLLVKEEQQRCRPTDAELLAGVPWLMAIARAFRAESSEDGQTHLATTDLLSERALRSAVDLKWKEGQMIHEARMELMSILVIGALQHVRKDLSFVTLEAPPLPDGSQPSAWFAFGSLLWYPPQQAVAANPQLSNPIIFTFHAWDLRHASVFLLDADLKDSLLDPLLRASPGFARVRKLVREARRSIGSEDDVRDIAAAAVSEYFLDPPPGEPPLNGLLADSAEPDIEGAPQWLITRKPRARFHALQRRVVAALERDAFGSGIDSARSTREKVPLEAVDLIDDRTNDSTDAAEVLSSLRSKLSSDELYLLDLLYEAWASGQTPTLPDIARQNGFDLADVTAVHKRIRNKAKKLR